LQEKIEEKIKSNSLIYIGSIFHPLFLIWEICVNIQTMNKFKKETQFVFLPGVPGKKKDFGFVTDLRSKGLSVIEYRHPGLYEEKGEFSVVNTIKKMGILFDRLEKAKTPYVIIAYSFSSLIIQKINISKYKYLRGVVMFSPILGLGLDWINENFNETLKQLTAEGNCWPAKDLGVEINDLKKKNYDFDILEKLVSHRVPVGLFFSKNDNVVNVKRLAESTRQFRDLFGQGSLFVMGESKGDHRIDTYYGECARNLLLSFVAREQVRNIIGDESHILVWGSSQSTNFFKDRYSDIDLYVLGENYLDYFSELSDLQLSFQSRFGVKLDLSINKTKDLLSERISRFNRGPLLAHALNHLYFNLGRKGVAIDVNFEDVKRDCYKATLSIYRECEKQISRINGSEEQVRWFAKLFTVAIFYLLHVRDNRNVDMNNLERWLDEKKDKSLIKLLGMSSLILTDKQKELRKRDWVSLLDAMGMMVEEEEERLGVVYKAYPLKTKEQTWVADTPGRSKVVISGLTKKVFKTYFLDSEEKIRDIKRVTQHIEQLKFMRDHAVNVPSGVELIESNSAILMDYVEGVSLDILIREKNPALSSIFMKLGNFISDLHKTLALIPPNKKILIKDDELNYHCARNFQSISLSNFLALGNTGSEKILKSLARTAVEVIEKYPEILTNNDVIYGDFKPENIFWSFKSQDVYVIDPMIALGRVSCDIGKMISRIILANPKIVDDELFGFVRTVRSNYGAKVMVEAQIMAALDILNFISRELSIKGKENEHKKINVYTTQLAETITRLLKGKLWNN